MEWESDSPCHAICTLDRDAGTLEGVAAGSQSLGFVEQSQGKGWCWLWRDGPRGGEGGDCGGKHLWRKARQSWKEDDIAESHVVGGAITIASLSPHASICSWTTERLAHQAPDTLNYRVGPHPRYILSAWCTDMQSRTQPWGPLYVPDIPNNREKPQAREPSKCLNGWSYGERQAKEPDRQLSEVQKKTDRVIIPAAEAVHVSAHLVLPGSPWPKQLCHLHAQPSLKQSCHRPKKKSRMLMHTGVVSVTSNSLRTCRLPF